MEDKTVPVKSADTLTVICPTCSARYNLPKYVEGQRYGCKRCSASLMFGKFALLQELGRGGFGVVYKAWQADLQRVVALKFLHSDNEESTERFIREARIAANLNHPNITAIYEVGTHEGKLYITMQFVDGQTTNKANFAIREAVQVMRDASLAVDYAHARDIIHRDIKPHNIMVTEERSGTSAEQTSRRTFVMDFGLARSVARGGTLTTEGQVMGTPAFMSPEQAEGKACDTRSDVYSLGATVYALTTRRAPFEHQTPLQVLMQVTRGNPTPPSQVNAEIDKGLEAIIMKAMAVDPAHRYPTAGRLAGDLTSWLAGGVTDAAPTLHLSATTKSSPAAGRRNRALMVTVGILLILVGAAGLAYQFYPQWNGSLGTMTNGGSTPTRTGNGTPATNVTPGAPIVLLDVRTNPVGAKMRIGNREWSTPATLNNREIGEGPHEIEIHHLGYKSVKETITLKAGPAPLSREWTLEREDRAVAFRIESTPPGARILINGKDLGAVTPHQVYRDQIGGAVAQIELELDGFQTATRPVEVTGVTQVVPIQLSPRTGTFDVSGTAPQATLYVFILPPGVKNPRAVTGLWSENVDSVEQALGALEGADAAFVTERLKILLERDDPRLRDRLKKLAATPPSPTAVRPDRSLTADGFGRATIENAWVVKRYRLFATSPWTTDYLTEEVEPRHKQETAIKVEMIRVGLLSAAALQPSLGQFRVTYADGSVAGQLVPGGAAVRLNSGLLTLQYVPAPDEKALKEFTVQADLKDRYDLTGNLFVLAGDTYEKDRNIPLAMRAYTRMLEEMKHPAAEEPERVRVAEKARRMYVAWADGLASRSIAGDLSVRIAEMRLKEPAEAVPFLLELYSAKEADRAGKSAAASALALAHARLKQPYEAVEWIERCVKNGADPGADSEGAVSAVIRKLPGLPERWTAVAQSIASIRKAAARKPGFLGIKVIEVPGKGLRVEAIAKGSPAELVGFQLGDILMEIGATALKAPADFTAAIAAAAAGDDIEIQFDRGGVRGKARLKLASVSDPEPEYIIAAPVPVPVARVGMVNLVHKTIGIVVKLDAGVTVQKSEVLDILRNGEVVAELIVEDIAGVDETYPNGSVRSKKTKGLIQKGDEVRKKK